MDYTTLSEGDKLSIAQSALRGLESDHFRAQMLHTQANQQAHLEQLEIQIDKARASVEKLEKSAAKEQKRIADENKDKQPDGLI